MSYGVFEKPFRRCLWTGGRPIADMCARRVCIFTPSLMLAGNFHSYFQQFYHNSVIFRDGRFVACAQHAEFPLNTKPHISTLVDSSYSLAICINGLEGCVDAGND